MVFCAIGQDFQCGARQKLVAPKLVDCYHRVFRTDQPARMAAAIILTSASASILKEERFKRLLGGKNMIVGRGNWSGVRLA